MVTNDEIQKLFIRLGEIAFLLTGSQFDCDIYEDLKTEHREVAMTLHSELQRRAYAGPVGSVREWWPASRIEKRRRAQDRALRTNQ